MVPYFDPGERRKDTIRLHTSSASHENLLDFNSPSCVLCVCRDAQ